jgi:hypothetical protein
VLRSASAIGTPSRVQSDACGTIAYVRRSPRLLNSCPAHTRPDSKRCSYQLWPSTSVWRGPRRRAGGGQFVKVEHAGIGSERPCSAPRPLLAPPATRVGRFEVDRACLHCGRQGRERASLICTHLIHAFLLSSSSISGRAPAVLRSRPTRS